MMGYYAGDPGFFSIIKSIGSAAVGMIPGVGPVASKIISKLPSGIRSAGGAIMKHPGLTAAGSAGALAIGAAGVAGRSGMLGRPAGKHPSARHLHALAMGLKRAKPRMNVTNVRAPPRPLGPAHGIAKLAMRAIHITHPKTNGRVGGYAQARRKRCNVAP